MLPCVFPNAVLCGCYVMVVQCIHVCISHGYKCPALELEIVSVTSTLIIEVQQCSSGIFIEGWQLSSGTASYQD